MFSALAGMYMTAKVHLTQAKVNAFRKNDKQVEEAIYKNKVDKQYEKEKYEKKKLPESGYMTLEEYESKSRGLTRREINAKILDKPDLPKDKNYVYVPQHKFKLVKYNDPIGSPELSLPRKLQFDRQINAQGIVSGDLAMIIYPAVYYYAEADCVSCDLFRINLDSTIINNVERVQKANVLNKEPKPILSTSKDIDRKYIFRTLTPIDFSADNKKLAIKEKIGYKHDGIWKTELWVYDFGKNEAKQLTALREAISYYWQKKDNISLDDNRWDIYPMGFDANNDNRIIVGAYAYTGAEPKFLGTWSIDVNNESAKLETLTNSYIPISVIGYKLSEDHEVLSISELEFEAKQAGAKEKEKKKQEKAERKLENAANKAEYLKKVRSMDAETIIKIKERQKNLKATKVKPKDGITNNAGEENSRDINNEDLNENTENNTTDYLRENEISEPEEYEE